MPDRRFKNTEVVLTKFANDVAQSSLSNQRRNPITIDWDLIFGPNSFALTFEGPPYTRFQDQGVQGHGKGNWTPKKAKSNKAPQSPFKYVTGPGKKTMLKSLVSKPSFRTRDLDSGRFTPKTQSNMNTAAFLIGRSIGRFGLKPKLFFTKAVDEHGPELTKMLGTAWVKDQEPFIKSIQDKFIKPNQK